MKKEKQIQIPEALFWSIFNYFAFYDNLSEECRKNMEIEIMQGLAEKNGAIMRREQYEKNLHKE